MSNNVVRFPGLRPGEHFAVRPRPIPPLAQRRRRAQRLLVAAYAITVVLFAGLWFAMRAR